MFFEELKEQPRIEISDLFAGMFIYLGMILFLVVLHILTIETQGDVSSVMNTIFIIFLSVFIFLLVVGMAYVVIHFLKYMVWQITTPAWKKKRVDNKQREQTRQNGNTRQ